ncbi:hypothetical protein HML84_05660 [Alcanivorax sp. IO_7]|nr:hypothetical protein HML84_05660 [Alcanivorax sp. IO_7]
MPEASPALPDGLLESPQAASITAVGKASATGAIFLIMVAPRRFIFNLIVINVFLYRRIYFK